MLKAFIDKAFWTVVHFLGHVLDFDHDGKLDVGDLKVVFAKFTEILPNVTAIIPTWNTLTLGAKLDALFTFIKGELPQFSAISDFIMVLLEAYAHISLKLDSPPKKLGPIPKD